MHPYLAAFGGAANRVTRLGGTDRYDTACTVAAATVSVLADKGRPYGGRVFVSTGNNFPDALAEGVMQGRLGSVVLLSPTDSLNTNARALMRAHKAEIHTVRYLGSTSALQRKVRDAVAAALR